MYIYKITLENSTWINVQDSALAKLHQCRKIIFFQSFSIDCFIEKDEIIELTFGIAPHFIRINNQLPNISDHAAGVTAWRTDMGCDSRRKSGCEEEN